MLAATLRAIERRQQRESQDASEFARCIGVAPDRWQEDLLRSEARYILLNCSRQAGKSTTTSILALHEAIHHAPALVLLAAPAMRQSQELFRKIKGHYAKLGPLAPRISEESALRLEIENGSRIVCLPGREATVRGYSDASLLILDEASRIDDELYQALRPMLAVSRGRIVLLSTPVGRRGFFFREWSEGGPDWWRVKITAYDCPRISHDWLDQERAAIGDWWFAQEYLCEFVDTQDQVFAYDDVMAALDPSIAPLFGGHAI